jgi:hypothetical protein
MSQTCRNAFDLKVSVCIKSNLLEQALEADSMHASLHAVCRCPHIRVDWSRPTELAEVMVSMEAERDHLALF